VSALNALGIAIARALSVALMVPAAQAAIGLALSARVLIAGALSAPAAIAAVLTAALPIAPVLIVPALSAEMGSSAPVLMVPAAAVAALSAGRGVPRARAALVRALPSRIAALIAALCGVSAISQSPPAR
jgi:hypothetical protein